MSDTETRTRQTTATERRLDRLLLLATQQYEDSPSDPEALSDLAWFYLAAGDIENARLWAGQLLERVDEDKPASGRYRARHPRFPVALDYICADVEVEKHEHGRHHLRVMPPGMSDTPAGKAPAKWGLLKVDKVIPRLGTEPPRDEWALRALRGRGRRAGVLGAKLLSCGRLAYVDGSE